jgi:hypothetical protein
MLSCLRIVLPQPNLHLLLELLLKLLLLLLIASLLLLLGHDCRARDKACASEPRQPSSVSHAFCDMH